MKPIPQLHPSVPGGEFNLHQLLEHEPPTRWQPEPGDIVQGTVVKVTEVTAYGTTAPTLFLLLPDDRFLSIRCGGVVLRRHVEETRPQPGDLVAVAFDGMRISQSTRREYAAYRFAIRRHAELTGGTA